jgi:hypothetical protein
MALRPVIKSAAKGGFLSLLLIAIACQGMQKTVRPEDRISLLEGGPHSGTSESQTTSIEYQYYKQSGELKLSVGAKVKTQAPYAGLKVWVLFVDAQGKILEEKSIDSQQSTFNIPPGAADLAFRTFLEPRIYKPQISR